MQMSSYEVDTMTSLSMLAHLHLPNLFYLSCLDDFVIELFSLFYHRCFDDLQGSSLGR